MAKYHRFRPSDLFLVRLWVHDDHTLPEAPNPGANQVDSSREQAKEIVVRGAAWQGKVQRVIDGEAHEFSDWHTLIDLLAAMLAARGEPDDKSKGKRIGEQEDEYA